MQSPELKITEDGSHTLYVPAIDECYHSTHGAVQESMLIFIQYGLLACTKNEINILEIGFGTGLNALLTLIEAEKSHKNVRYTTLELYPLEAEKAVILNYPEVTDTSKRREFELLHTSEWGQEISVTPGFQFKKLETDFTQADFTAKYDVIYFDAFSPEKQPEMWTEDLFRKLHQCSAKNGILTTYYCKGSVKRALKSAGFSIEKLPGPAGKREILRAVVSTPPKVL